MRETKLFEIRDRGTRIPALAVRVIAGDDDDGYLLRIAGYGPGQPYILLFNLVSCEGSYDPFKHPGSPRTMNTAHLYIERTWAALSDGAVIDVEYILGETKTPKVSERQEEGVDLAALAADVALRG